MAKMRLIDCEPHDDTWGKVVVRCNILNQADELVLVNDQVILAGRRPNNVS